MAHNPEGMIASLVLALFVSLQDARAVYHLSDNPILDVSLGGRHFRMKAIANSPIFPSNRTAEASSRAPVIRGVTLTVEGSKIVVGKRSITLNPPTAMPPLDGSHSFVLSESGWYQITPDEVVWLFVRSDTNNMGEPVESAYAYAIGLEGEQPVVRKVISLPGLGGHYSVASLQHGRQIMMRDSIGHLCDLDTADWSLRSMPYENTALTAGDRVFWQDGRELKLWSWVRRKWHSVGMTGGGSLQTVVRLANDDLIQYDDRIQLLGSGRAFLMPPLDKQHDMFFDDRVGLAIVFHKSEPPYREGMLLSLRDLSVRCPVEIAPEHN